MANVRISSVVQRPDGLLVVSGVLPDGAHVENVVVESHDRAEIARAMVTAEYHRPLPHLTGFIELPDAEYDALRPQGHAKNANAAADRYARENLVVAAAAAEEESDASDESKASDESTEAQAEGESSDGAEKSARRARR